MITVEDDGKGIDAEKVKAKAIANKVISQAESETMGENEAAKLIFHPGLSTADEVTSLSGRVWEWMWSSPLLESLEVPLI